MLNKKPVFFTKLTNFKSNNLHVLPLNQYMIPITKMTYLSPFLFLSPNWDAESWLSGFEFTELWLPALETGADSESEACREVLQESVAWIKLVVSSSLSLSFGGRCLPKRMRLRTLFNVELLFLSVTEGDLSGVVNELACLSLGVLSRHLPSGLVERLRSMLAMFCSMSINICCSSSNVSLA